MVAEIDTWRAAKLLVAQHGEQADAHAAQRAIDMHDAGDAEGEAVWLKIFDCIRTLQRQTPSDGESRH
jgi:hypothetical protein